MYSHPVTYSGFVAVAAGLRAFESATILPESPISPSEVVPHPLFPDEETEALTLSLFFCKMGMRIVPASYNCYWIK